MSLSQIILRGNIAHLRDALAKTPDVNILDEYGYTPLIECVIANDLEKAKLVRQAGADVNQADLTGRTALHWAVNNNNRELAAWLLAEGANVNAYPISGEPILVKPLLSNHADLKNLLISHGAQLNFAYDYIHAKLLGHRYELIGSVDITTADGKYVEVDYEGFYLDASLLLIAASLADFRTNFEARYLQNWFEHIDSMIDALHNAAKVLQFDHYLQHYTDHRQQIAPLLKPDPVIIPVNQEAHAFTLIRAANLFAICDRAPVAHQPNSGIVIYYMNRPVRFNDELLLPLIYEKQPISAIKDTLKNSLQLQPIATLDISSQKIGNCSWANVEAIVPVLHAMLNMNNNRAQKPSATKGKPTAVTSITSHAKKTTQRNDNEDNKNNPNQIIIDSLELFHRWREWDRERATHFFVTQLTSANPQRRASIAALLAGLVFQTCSADNNDDIERAKNLIRLIKRHGFNALLDTYIKYYVYEHPTAAGKNLQRLLDVYARDEL